MRKIAKFTKNVIPKFLKSLRISKFLKFLMFIKIHKKKFKINPKIQMNEN